MKMTERQQAIVRAIAGKNTFPEFSKNAYRNSISSAHLHCFAFQDEIDELQNIGVISFVESTGNYIVNVPTQPRSEPEPEPQLNDQKMINARMVYHAARLKALTAANELKRVGYIVGLRDSVQVVNSAARNYSAAIEDEAFAARELIDLLTVKTQV